MDEKIKVNLSNNRSYEINIGYDNFHELINYLLKNYSKSKIGIITDSNVENLYLKNLSNILDDNNLKNFKVVIPAGEQSKSFDWFKFITNELIKKKIQRDDLIIALGGGVVGDLAGFSAGVIRRGISIIQVPTSLIGQVDSAIGGKTGIDNEYGKNLVGIFHQPKLVHINTRLLNSLPKREFLSGYSEIIKYALINDLNFFLWLEENFTKIINNSKEELLYAIKKCAFSKACIVSNDEAETGEERILLNLGHTFGHAIEKALNFSEKIRHGEAVSIGIRLAFELSVDMKICKKEDLDRVKSHLVSVGLPVDLKEINNNLTLDELYLPIFQDKKIKNGKPVFVLAERIGKAIVYDNVSEEEIKLTLSKIL